MPEIVTVGERVKTVAQGSRGLFTFSSVSLKGHLMRMTFCSEAGTAEEREQAPEQTTTDSPSRRRPFHQPASLL